MVREFIDAVKDGGEAPIPMYEIIAVTRATLGIVESLRSNEVVTL
jgi:hypothetical protein